MFVVPDNNLCRSEDLHTTCSSVPFIWRFGAVVKTVTTLPCSVYNNGGAFMYRVSLR